MTGMAASHKHTDEYMARMYRGLEEMGVDTADDPYKPSFDEPRAAPPGRALPASLAHGAIAASTPSSASAGWSSGPLDPAGRACSVSERPLLCMSVHGDLAVVGSSDHGLSEVALGGAGELRVRRNLFTRAYGHSEWVTSVAHLPDGRILSAGMDSKLCLWNAAGAPKCTDMLGHTGSVACALVSADGAIGASASYDKTVRLWSLSGAGSELDVLRAHRAPVMHLSWSEATLASADRDGAVVTWDVTTGAPLARPAHRGHATALAATADNRGAHLASGGQDGVVCLWDHRSPTAAATATLHTGAVNCLQFHVSHPSSSTCQLLSAGADGVLHLLDLRAGLASVHRWAAHKDFIYSMTAIGHVALTGGGALLSSSSCRARHVAPRAVVVPRRALRVRVGRRWQRARPRSDTWRRGVRTRRQPRRSARDAREPITPCVYGRRRRRHRVRFPRHRRRKSPRAEPRAEPAAGGRAGGEAGGGDAQVGGAGARTRSPEELSSGCNEVSQQTVRSAQAYADKKRAAMERAAAIKAERQAKERAAAGGALGDALGGGRGVGAPFEVMGQQGPPAEQPEPMSELDQLHALGDKKFGRGRGRR